MTTVSLPQAGGCACGNVRYALTAAPLLAYACHCHSCQTRSGSAFSLTIVTRAADIAVVGEPETVRVATPSGREVDHSRCPHCGFRVFARAPVAPDYLSVVAGTLDDASWVVPIAQIWADSAIPWAIIPGVRSVPTDDFDYVELGRDYAAATPRFVTP